MKTTESYIGERFCLHIDYDSGVSDPARIFRALTGMIEAFESLDRHILRPISTSYEPEFMLDNFEVSSLKTRIVAVLKETDDEHLKDLEWKKIVGKHAVQVKYALINFLEGKTTIVSINEIKELEASIERTAEASGIKQLLEYSLPNTAELLTDISAFGEALQELSPNDRLALVAGKKTALLNTEFRLAPETIRELTTSQSLTNETTVILKVRRPDFIGDAQWEFRHGSQTLKAKIIDKAWLSAFHNRSIDIRPGDALKVRLETTETYDFHNEVSSTNHTITSVIAVINADEPDQSALTFSE